MTSKLEILNRKLEKFIRRYYKNLIIKGLLYFLTIIGILFLTYVILEYYGYFSTFVRSILFYSFVVCTIFLLIKYIIIPFLKLLHIGKTIEKEDAARLIGKHFKGIIDDKIVNTLQLQNYLNKNGESFDLLVASIDQKANNLLNVRFENVINFKDNLKYVYWALIPVCIILIIIVSSPYIIVESAGRIIKYDQYFERPAPFDLFIKNQNLQAFQNEDFKINIGVQGDVLPGSVGILDDKVEYEASKNSNDEYTYTFNNLQNDVEFYLVSGRYSFGPYTIEVVPKPHINNFRLKVNSPGYTDIPTKTYENFGDVNIAEGSEVNFIISSRFTDVIDLKIDKDDYLLSDDGKGLFTYTKQVFESFDVQLFAKNDHIDRGDSLKYFINVVNDQYPEISVEEYQDNVLIANRFFSGIIRDDYGFSDLKFKYRKYSTVDEGENSYIERSIDINPNVTNQDFFYNLDINKLDIRPGEQIEYFFTVWDNDQINGAKKARSKRFYYRRPTGEELAEESIKNNQEIREEIGSNVSQVRESRDDIDELRRRLLDHERVGWEEKELLNEILRRQGDLEEKIDEMSRKKKESEERYEQFGEKNEDIEEMQDQLQEEFDELMTDELKELMESIKEELDKMGRDEMYDNLEDLDFELSFFEQQLERLQELYKKLELKNLLFETVENINRLSEEQDLLKENILNEDEIEEDDSFLEKQKEIEEKFGGIEDMMEDLKEKTDDLKGSQDFPSTDDIQHNINFDLKEAVDGLENMDFENVIDHQENAYDQMQNLSKVLDDFQDSLFDDQLAEDAKLLRQLLENLLETSFNQEDLIYEVQNININDPRYVEMIQEQRKISDDLKVVEDSLVELGKRQVEIQSYITREISEINRNIDRSIKDLIDRRRRSAVGRQQFVMTHINNLTLLLNESLENMQMQLAMQEGHGDPQGNGGAPSLEDIIDMQEAVNEMLEQAREGHIPEEGEGTETMSLSEQLARMSQQQENIRNMLKSITDELKKDLDFNTTELENIQEEMEQTELDIITKNINRNTQLRQERILTRLLEHEKALMEREFEEERVGDLPEFYELSNPNDFFEYNRLKDSQTETLINKEVQFNRYYKNLVEKYLIKFN